MERRTGNNLFTQRRPNFPHTLLTGFLKNPFPVSQTTEITNLLSWHKCTPSLGEEPECGDGFTVRAVGGSFSRAPDE